MYTQGQAIDFIQKVFGEVRLTTGGLNAIVICPFCNDHKDNLVKKKLAIRTDNLVSHCWVCGYKSRNIYYLVKRYHPEYLSEYENIFGEGLSGISVKKQGCVVVFEDDLSNKLNNNKDEQDETFLRLPKGFTLLAEHFHNEDADWYIRNAKNYLINERGLTYRDFWYFKLGVTSEDPHHLNRIIVPSFGVEGNLNYFTARAIHRKLKPKYVNPSLDRKTVIFNEINIDWTQELTLVEGSFDLMKCNDNATCILGSELDTYYALFQMIVKNNTPVLLALDADALDKALRIASRLTSYGISVRLYELPPGKHDVGEMTREEFISLIPNAMLFTMDTFIHCRIASIQ